MGTVTITNKHALSPSCKAMLKNATFLAKKASFIVKPSLMLRSALK